MSEPLLHVDKFEEILQNITRHPEANAISLSIKLGVPDEIVRRVKDIYSFNVPTIDYQQLEKNIENMKDRLERLEYRIPMKPSLRAMFLESRGQYKQSPYAIKEKKIRRLTSPARDPNRQLRSDVDTRRVYTPGKIHSKSEHYDLYG